MTDEKEYNNTIEYHTDCVSLSNLLGFGAELKEWTMSNLDYLTAEDTKRLLETAEAFADEEEGFSDIFKIMIQMSRLAKELREQMKEHDLKKTYN